MKSVVSFTALLMLITLCQTSIAQNVDIVGGLDVSGGVNAASLTVSGNSPVFLTTSATTVLNLRANNPLIEFRATNNDYLSFIQNFGMDFYVANRVDGKLFLRTNNINRLTISESGNVGVGTSIPLSKLSVIGPESDGTIGALEVRSGTQTLIMDGNEIDCANGGLFINYNSLHDVLMRTNVRRAEMTFEHATGSGLSNGVSIANPGGNDAYWTLYSTNGDGFLELYYQGSFRGEFNAITGVYTSVSDRRLKQNISPLENILDRVLRLNPSRYMMKDRNKDQYTIGFIAQDVKPYFPELVHHGTIGDTHDAIYTVDYSGFGVLAIAAIKELAMEQRAQLETISSENQELNELVEALKVRVEKLEAQLDSTHAGIK